MDDDKFKSAIKDLAHALSFEKRGKSDAFFYAGIAKQFEVCFEYAWKSLRARARNEGLTVHSPREAIKMAGKLGIIDDVELWLAFLQDRNLAVHDYIGVEDEGYLKTIKTFMKEVKKLG